MGTPLATTGGNSVLLRTYEKYVFTHDDEDKESAEPRVAGLPEVDNFGVPVDMENPASTADFEAIPVNL